jgi:hypothetical protein
MICIFVVGKNEDWTHGGPYFYLLGLLLLVALLSMVTFYVSLARFASRLGRSTILWVGGSWLTTPFGPIVAYLRMQDIALELQGLKFSVLEVLRDPRGRVRTARPRTF